MPIKDLRIDLNPGLKKLDIYARRDVLSKTLEGEWSTVFKGRGIEFAGFRNYVYGDDASLIDWRASLRAKETLIREFEDYKNFTVFFLFDISDKMLFSSGEKLKAEFAAEVIYVLADAINRAGDSVGMAMFNDSFVNSVIPNIGSEVLKHMESNIKDPRNYGGGFDLKKALLMSRNLIGNKAVIVIVSDFLGLEKNWHRYVQMMSDNYELIALMIKDPRDRELPKSGGQFMLKDPMSGENIYVDVAKYANQYKELSLKHEQEVEKIFKRSRGDFILLQTNEDDYVKKLVTFFQRRSLRQD